MVGFPEQNAGRRVAEASLETPRVVGYRSGMTAASLIGRRLARVYDIASDVPRDMDVLLSTLDGKVGPR